MSTFRFDLQKVLDLREREEQQRARLLVEAERRVREAQANLDVVQRIRGEGAKNLMAAHGRGQSVGHLRNLSTIIRQLTQQVADAEKAVREAAERVEASRLELVTTARERRVLDQLRARKEEAWRRQQLSVERKVMDELALGIFQRKNGGNGEGGS